jgi:hypothetical protein
MLAADDIVVGLVSNAIVLTLDSAGVQITDLHTSYNAASSLLTITAARSGGTISTSGVIPGVAASGNTITVNLATITNFAGISVAGGVGVDAVTIGAGGVNLSAVTKGLANQEFSITTGAGLTDTITVANAISSKGAGAVSLTTLGTGLGKGIQLAASVTSPLGAETFAGAVYVPQNVLLKAGGNIVFSSTIDGASRLTLSSGAAITMAGAVGGTTPLKGITLAAAKSVAVNGAVTLDGTGTAAGTSGLVIAANVNNVVFSPASKVNARTISGFSGSGIQFLGGSTGSRITNVTSTGNGVGLQVGPGSYTGTVISGNTFSSNAGNGVTLNSAKGIMIGGGAAGAGNALIFNGGYGFGASGTSTGSVVDGNQISNNVLGSVAGLAVGNWFIGISAAPGLTVRVGTIGQAAFQAGALGQYSFGMTIDVNGVSIGSTGVLKSSQSLIGINATVQSQRTEFRQIGSVIYTNAQRLGATGLPWVSLNSASQPAFVAVSSLVSGLTPTNTLKAVQFPISSQFVGTDAFGRRYQATIGTSTFAALLPLSNLTELATKAVFGNSAVPVDVWLNAAGYLQQLRQGGLRRRAGRGTDRRRRLDFGSAIVCQWCGGRHGRGHGWQGRHHLRQWRRGRRGCRGRQRRLDRQRRCRRRGRPELGRWQWRQWRPAVRQRRRGRFRPDRRDWSDRQ